MNTATTLNPFLSATAASAAEITFSAAGLRRGLELVCHASGAPFASRTHIDLDWAADVDVHGRHVWAVTATDGFRLARFTTNDAARFDAHACRVSLPHWIVDWCKVSDSATVTIRTQANRAEFWFSDYGMFRPKAAPFFQWTHLVGTLRHSNSTPLFYSRTAADVSALITLLKTARRDTPDGGRVFIVPGSDRTWSHSFGEKPKSVVLSRAYLVASLKSLARAAKREKNATVDARWSGALDPVVFTTPHLLAVVMPSRL